MKAPPRRKTNLVPALGRFVGRAAVLDDIATLASRGERLITLLGAPGIGKTRLAIRHGELTEATGGVWFCDLTEARDAADLSAAVALVLGLRLASGVDGDASEIVGAAIAEAGPILLILDNFEQLAKGTCARIVERWCAVAPEACFLVTSRTRLEISGECVVELPALDGAAELFIDRARAAGWNDTRPSATEEVAALVAALDGIPLAIELAAARSRVLAPKEMLARIERDRSAVLPTLKAAIDSSWSMLAEREQTALAECSVFAGDFSLEAAEAVLSVENAIDVLGALRDRSLVRSMVDTETGSTRFSLFVSIREYASERARERLGDGEALARRYRRFYIEQTSGWVEEHTRTGDRVLLAKLTREKEHLETIQRSLRSKKELLPDEKKDLARTVLHLQPVITTEIFGKGGLLAMLTSAIEHASAEHDLHARLLFARGLARGVRGDLAGSVHDLEAASQDAPDAALEGAALYHLGARYRVQTELALAERVTARAIALLEEIDPPHPRLLGQALACMGLLLGEQGRAEEARPENLRARAVLRACGDGWSEALALANLAQLDQAAGAFDEAAHGYDRALERFHDSGDRRFEGRYRGYRAGLELERGAIDAARRDFATALEILDVAKATHIEGATRAALGALEAMSGHAREAMSELERAEDLLRTTNAPGFVAALDVHRGQLDLLRAREATAKGDAERAKRLSVAAEERIERARSARSEDARFAIRLLERELERWRPSQPPPSSIPGARLPTLDVGPEARWFRVGDGEPVDLGRRGALRLLLEGLVSRRESSPSTTTDWEALLAIGWPGERVLAGAGATRVRVAVSTLRRLGLAGLLVTREDGYLIDPRVPIRRREDSI